jgi:hypothetical protein
LRALFRSQSVHLQTQVRCIDKAVVICCAVCQSTNISSSAVVHSSTHIYQQSCDSSPILQLKRFDLFSKHLLCLYRKYDIVINTEYFYCTCLYPPSLVQWIQFIFLACHWNMFVGDCRRLLASSIVFFHSTFSVGCRYLGDLPYTVLEFGERYMAFTLQ